MGRITRQPILICRFCFLADEVLVVGTLVVAVDSLVDVTGVVVLNDEALVVVLF